MKALHLELLTVPLMVAKRETILVAKSAVKMDVKRVSLLVLPKAYMRVAETVAKRDKTMSGR